MVKKLDRLILKSFLGPLALTFVIAVFVLLMQFVWKYIDDMVGKGLDFLVIGKLLFYASATFVPMALPIAILFASIMTMGNFGERYELVAMKAGGVPLSRAMRPMAVVAMLLAGTAFYFANNVLPVAMLQYRTILYDVTRKKPAINIRPSEYYTDIENYVIRANEKDPDGSTLRDITIYDHSQGIFRTNVITARSGHMQSSADDRYLFFTLHDGCAYSEECDITKNFSRPLTRVSFDQQVITFDISSFAFAESDTKFFEGNYQMMNVAQLKETAQRLSAASRERHVGHIASIRDTYRGFDDLSARAQIEEEAQSEGEAQAAPELKAAVRKGEQLTVSIVPTFNDPVNCPSWDLQRGLAAVPEADRKGILLNAKSAARSQIDKTKMFQQLLDGDMQYIARHHIERQRKFTLSLACLLLFLVGAPFGSLVRKGGLGMPLVASVGFFVLYYVVGMICEKAVRESAIGPIGMWISTFVMLPIGLLLTAQATTDRTLAIGQLWEKLKLRKQVKT